MSANEHVQNDLQMNIISKMILTCLLLSIILVLSSCSTAEAPVEQDQNNDPRFEVENNPVVTIEMEDGGVIQIELYPHIAPNTVLNFISLVEKGFYNQLTFHRVVENFMIQGGDPQGNGRGGPGYTIPGEFTSNGFHNDLRHERGVISMAKATAPNTAGSQFFIMHKNTPSLDGSYAAFGQVISGLDVLDRIAQVETKGETPVEPPVMSKVTVETFGEKYDEPNKTGQ